MNAADRPLFTLALLWLVLSSSPSGQAADDPGPPESSAVIINEFSAKTSAEVVDDDGDAVDWIEIHNRGSIGVSLDGWHLTDDATNSNQWAFPDIEIAANAYLLVFASGKDRSDPAQPLHANFKLDVSGEYLALTQPDGTPTHVFQPTYPTQGSGAARSYGVHDSGSMRFFLESTPGDANTTRGVCFVADTKFSIDRGFYDQPFEVEITCATPDAIIRYTTDGAEPTPGTLFGGANGTIYDGPITIDQTTVLRAKATRSGWESSNVDTQTYLFLNDVIRQSPNEEKPPGWPTKSVNGQVFDFGMDPEIVDSPEYADQILPALRDLPSMSLVMDHDDLTDSKDGIYVNASSDGRSWERPGSLELLHPDGQAGFHINAGVRIRGGFSRMASNPKHSFRLFFRDEYGEATLRYPLFGNEGADAFKKLDFRTAQNYAWSLSSSNDARKNTFLREIFARDSQRELGQPYTRSRYYHLYLNGLYWGLYMSQERAGEDYAETYFGGDSKDYDVIKVEAGPYSVYATSGSIDAYDELHALVVGDITDADFYALQGKNPQGEDDLSLTKHIDVDNLIEYMLIIFYVGSTDAPLAGSGRANNFYAVRNREARDGWRFFSHDTEHSMLTVRENRMGPYDSGRSRQFFNPQYLHQQLMQSDAYRLAFADHVRREFFDGGVFTVESARARWQQRQEEIQLAIIAESARWGDQHVNTPYTKETWLEATDWILDNFIPARTEIVFDQLEGKGLTGDLLTPEFSQHGGIIENPDTFKFKFTVGTLFRPQAGDIYYTLDGSDPKQLDGSVASAAILYDRGGSGVALSATSKIRARLVHEAAWSPINEATFIAGGALATAENLVISEIMYHAPDPDANSAYQDESAFEFIELWNPSNSTVDLTGAKFTNGIEFVFPAVQLGPDQRAVLVNTHAAFEERYGTTAVIIGSYGGANASQLSNSGERLTLRNITDDVITDFRYNDAGDWPASADGSGSSLARSDPASDAGDAASWQASTTPSPGTAGNVVVPGSGYAEWKLTNGIEDDLGDPDRDGLTNFAEYAVGDNPEAPTPDQPMQIMRQADGTLIVRVLKATEATDLTIELESSSDLANWSLVTDLESLPSETISATQSFDRWRATPIAKDIMAFRARYSIQD